MYVWWESKTFEMDQEFGSFHSQIAVNLFQVLDGMLCQNPEF